MNTRILITLCISIMSTMIGIGILLPILPLYAENMGASGSMIGIIFSSFAITLAIANPITGRISDRIGYKPIIILGLSLHIPVALLYVIATSPWHLVIIRLAEGVVCAMVQTAAMAYAGSIAPKDKEGSYLGTFNTFIYLGLGTGPLMGGYLAQKYSVQMPFYAMAAFLCVALLFVLIWLPAYRHTPSKQNPAEATADKPSIKGILALDAMKGLLLFAIIISLGQSGMMTFLPILVSKVEISTTQIGILSSVIMLCAGILQTPFGYLANKYDKTFMVVAGTLMVGVILAYIPLCSRFSSFLVLSIIGGTGGAIATPAAVAIVVRNTKNMGLGFTMGIYHLCFGIGMIAGPVLSGLIMDLSNLNNVFYFSSVLFILSTMAIHHYTKEK
ncbi:MAG: MFS transporter [Thermodesulfobacteriota bacterium]|nr:MFS transporter [Thermodesulfobacteriota bacterium]